MSKDTHEDPEEQLPYQVVTGGLFTRMVEEEVDTEQQAVKAARRVWKHYRRRLDAQVRYDGVALVTFHAQRGGA